MEDSDEKIAKTAGQIQDKIKEQNLLPSKMRIIANITDRNKVLSKRWTDKFAES